MADPNAYFDWLSARGDFHAGNSYRSQSLIDASEEGANPSYTYDAALDACKVTRTSAGNNPGNMSLYFDALIGTFSGGTDTGVLLTWDMRIPASWAPKNQFITTMKSYQIGSRHGAVGDLRRMETQINFVGRTSPEIATVTWRFYGWPTDDGTASNQFIVYEDTWTRIWAFVDFANELAQVWVADENQTPIHNLVDFALAPDTGREMSVDLFYLEYNTSQENADGPLDDNVSGAVLGVSLVGTRSAGVPTNLWIPSGVDVQVDNDGSGNIDYVLDCSLTTPSGSGGANITYWLAEDVENLRIDYGLEGAGNTCDVQLYNWGTTSWDSWTTINGETGANADSQFVTLPLDPSKYIGTGADDERYVIRFTCTSQTGVILYLQKIDVGAPLHRSHVRNLAVIANPTDVQDIIDMGANVNGELPSPGPKGRSARRRGGRGRTRI